ncbi:MAG: type II toxin-antitoxin system prevent-host-death family antitoxin [Propionibacteriaceae bacterium]|nr:type II toxin-antitoxin system prevent-host-death family antitoxin [Propionibacteriaceae bacterium]
MAHTIGSYEAKTHLARLLDDVEAGEAYVITKHGRPVARLTPIRGSQRPAVVSELLAFRRGKRLGLPIREAIDAGRRH